MKIDIVTIFPSMFDGPFNSGLIKRATDKKIVETEVVDLRQFADDQHKTTDDHPFGGGPGMVMKVEPIFKAVEHLRRDDTAVILLSPQGKKLDQALISRLARLNHVILLCGRYKGVDERVRELVIDEEISVGDYILSGGELAAMVLTDAIVRLLPGAMNSKESAEEDSFQSDLLDSPRYTRPRHFRARSVPEVLISGDHQEIKKWRRRMAIKKTMEKRPDLLEKASLTDEDRKSIQKLRRGSSNGPDQEH